MGSIVEGLDMLAFEVFVDDERMCLGGMEDWAVMTVIVSGVRHRGPKGEGAIDLSVGGLSETSAKGGSRHATWGRFDLEVGSKVTINVVDTDHPDAPIRRYREGDG